MTALKITPLFGVLSIFAISFLSCQDGANTKQQAIAENTSIPHESNEQNSTSQNFKKYWYGGEAEITSYTLTQARYGELRSGTAVHIFVTEPFLKEKQVKADYANPDNIPVLKLNTTKNFITGIYPYSLMTSSFYPVKEQSHALKISYSSQEWCGQVYTQLNNKAAFEITGHSYFEKEGDASFSLEKTFLEDELWNMIRINPTSLPQGDFALIPSLEFCGLNHLPLKAYSAKATLEVIDAAYHYKIVYPTLQRTLIIIFSKEFPFTIESWSDKQVSKGVVLTSKATKIKTIRAPYWQQNKNKDLYLRNILGL